jgi:hypothetical protein
MADLNTDGEAETVYLNGLGEDGLLLVPPVKIPDLAQRLRTRVPKPFNEEKSVANKANTRSLSLPDSINPDCLEQAGWGLVVPESRKEELVNRVRLLWKHRAEIVPTDRLKVLTYHPGESVRAFLKNYKMATGNILPTCVPYHLLLLATPEEISFEFQYLLGLEYSVGRLSFAEDDDWTRYCEAVIRAGTGEATRSRKIAWFAPKSDPATNLSHDELVVPLMSEGLAAYKSRSNYVDIPLLAKDATRDELLKALVNDRPALLFSASHGLGLPCGHDDQARLQGALITADWQGGPIDSTAYFAAEEVQTDLTGMIAFLFACFGNGTPEFDDYPMDRSGKRRQLADGPFLAALPRAMLANGALAVVGHVDRAWGYSIRPAMVRERIGPFRMFVDRILHGRTVGSAVRGFGNRSALLAYELLEAENPLNDESLVWNWVERNDARGYIILGDPAARLI